MTQSSTSCKLGIVSFLGVSCIIAAGDRALAQSITLDGSLGPAGTLTGPVYVIPQAAGQTVDTNLFHSFGQFGLNTGEAAIFDSAGNINNILSRVTGGFPSVIDGQILTLSPSVNLFLINPSGVVFGPNASLNVGGTTRGSFVATTTDAISWSNGGQFSATNPGGASSLLTLVGDPSGFLGSLRPPQSIFSLGTLSVYPSQSLLLLGGNVELYGSILNAPGGRVELGALNGAGTVSLNGNFSLSFPANVGRSDVFISDSSLIDVKAGSGGNIGINAQNIDVLGASTISAGIASGQGLASSAVAGDINLNATNAISVGQGSFVENNVNSNAIGNSGNVNIQTGLLFVSEGSQIQSLTRGFGNTGTLSVTADEIYLSGLDTNRNPGGLVNNVEPGAEGNASRIVIDSDFLSLSNGGQIQALTRGLGNAGVVEITAGDVLLSGVNDGIPSGIFSTVENLDAQGTGGVIGIQANSLSLFDGAQIQTLTRGQGNAGSVGIVASNITVNGFDPTTGLPSGIVSSVEEGAQLDPVVTGEEDDFGVIISTDSLFVGNGGRISTDTSGVGTAGVVFISATGDVSVTGSGSKISSDVTATGEGNAVGVALFANTVSITDSAEISSSTSGLGDAGVVAIQSTGDLSVRGSGSRISSNVTSTGEGNAVGVGIVANTVSITDGAEISSSTFGLGDAGEVIIQGTESVFLTNGDIRTTLETGATGDAGSISINTGVLNVSNGGQIQALTRGAGDAGLVEVKANDVVLSGVNNGFPSGIFSTVANSEAEGAGGIVRIEANSLNILEGAQIQTLTRGQGDAGSVGLVVNNISISGFDPVTGIASGIFSSVEEGAKLKPVLEGEERSFGIAISTESLSISNGGGIVTDTSGVGTAGVVLIESTGNLSVEGVGSRISSNVNQRGEGNAVGVIISANSVSINDGAEVSSRTSGRGNAGGVIVVADAVSSANGKISTTVEPGAIGNGGAILVFANSFSLTDSAVVSADTSSSGNAGGIGIAPFVEADGSFVTNNSIAIRDGSKISTSVTPTGRGTGGSIALTSQTLSLTGGGEIIAQTLGDGKAGTIEINATDFVELAGVAPFPILENGNIGGFSSGLFSTSEEGASNDGGEINITTNNLRVVDGATISARSRSAFIGGNITVNARELEVTGGGQLLSTAFSSGDAGSITINVSDRITITGTDPTYFQRFNSLAEIYGQQQARQTIDPISPASGVFANTDIGSTGDGGSIFIDPRQFTISDGGRVSVSSLGQGNGGNLQIQAGNITLNRDGAIEATTASGEGGNINISAQDLLLLRRNSNISSKAGGSGNGGNIDIDTTFIVAQPQEDSNIIADAIEGRGGNINIAAQGIFGIQSRPEQTPESDITASSQLGIDGTVDLNTPDVDPAQGLVALPVDTVDASSQIASGCTNSGNASNNKFTVTGRGGLPPNPGNTLGGEEVLTDWATLEESEVKNSQPPHNNSSRKNSSPEQVVEAQGWVFDAQGKVILTAQAPTATPSSNKLNATSCQK